MSAMDRTLVLVVFKYLDEQHDDPKGLKVQKQIQ